MFRRRKDPNTERILRAFGTVADRIDAAQRALLTAIPTSRDPGVPLAFALAGFSKELSAAESAMSIWREPALEESQNTCMAAIAAARAQAERLRLSPVELGFEALNAAVGEVLHPLEAFSDVERVLRGR